VEKRANQKKQVHAQIPIAPTTVGVGSSMEMSERSEVTPELDHAQVEASQPQKWTGRLRNRPKRRQRPDEDV